MRTFNLTLFLSLAIGCGTATAQNTNPWPSAGSVGIGTTTPDHLLTVNGITHIGNDLILTRTDGFTGGASIVLDNQLSKSLFFQKAGGGNIDVINLMGSSIGLNGNTVIGSPVNNPSGMEKLNIYTHSANDGIWLAHDGSSYGGLSGFVNICASSFGQGSWNGITASGDAGIAYGTANQTTANGFIIAPWAAATSGLRLDKSGNVGIATSDTKGYQLAVNGSAIFTKAVVKEYGNWPDYVFNKRYRLPSLDSVESYIQAHRHLPEIASADDIEASGLDVGAGQAALLKKIEELTLYVIQQNKTIRQQSERIDRLESRLNQVSSQR